MPEIPLNQLIRQFQVGLDELVTFLNKNGYKVVPDPGATVSDMCLPLLKREYGNNVDDSDLDLPEVELFKLKVLYVDDFGRVITDGFDHPQYGYFNNGILFPQFVFDKGKPIPIDLAQEFTTSYFEPGGSIYALYHSSCLNDTCALLIYEASFNLFEKDDKDFYENELSVGEIYDVCLEGATPNYYIVSIEGTYLKAVVRKDDIPAGAVIEKLQLAEKASSISCYSRFVWPAIIQEVDDSYSDDIVAKFLGSDAMSVIAEEDIKLVKLMLQKHPGIKREKADIVNDTDLYVRLGDDYRLSYEHHRNDIDNRVFWIAVYQPEGGEAKLYLYHEKPTVVIEISLKDDGFWVSKMVTDQDRGGDAKYFIRRFNRSACLKFPSSRIHFIDRFGALPIGYNCDEIFDYLFRLDDFNRNILSRIEDTLQAKYVENAHDYKLLDKYLRYQSKKELEKAGTPIEISASRLRRGSAEYLGGNPTLAFMLSENEINELLSDLDSSEETSIHLSVYDYDGERYCENKFFASLLSFRDGVFYQTFKNPSVSLDEFLSDGIVIGRTSNTMHFDIQTKAINSFLANRKGIFHDLVVGTIDTPDETKYKKLKFFNSKFYSQEEGSHQCDAVRKALGNKNVVLIQGPPGTGKTTIIVEIIKQLVNEGKKVLVCSQAHAAVGNIRDRFDRKTDDLRILRIDDDGDIESWSYLFKPEEYESFLVHNKEIITDLYSPSFSEENLRAQIKTYQYGTDSRTFEYREMHDYVINNRCVLEGLDRKEILSIFPTLLDAPSDLDNRMLEAQLYQSMDVVMGTCIGIGMNKVLRSGVVHFDTVIIDEAAKANLSETLVPMRLGDRFVLVGDHNQLPPYVDREEITDFVETQAELQENVPEEKRVSVPTEAEMYEALSNSVFAYFYNHPNFPDENKITLNYQYRMHPEIGGYISDLFYNSELKSGRGTEKNVLSIPGCPSAVTFFDTSNREKRTEVSSPDRSYFNPVEANLICEEIVPKLIPSLSQNTDLRVGIITPYKAQFYYLKKCLKESGLDGCVYTIDSIQGSEFDIVVFSFVRSFHMNSNKKVGFLDDMRRLNVSLSRAKRKLILVGDSRTLLNENAHINNPFFVINPIDVFQKICSTRERISNADELHLFLQEEPCKGTLFENCSYSDQGNYLVVHIEINGHKYMFRVAKNGPLSATADTVDVIYKGSNIDNKPQFYLSFYRRFKERHLIGEIMEGTINGILPPKDGSKDSRYQVYLDIDGAIGTLKMPQCPKELGEKLWVKIIGFDDVNCKVRLGAPVERWKVIRKNKFPVVTILEENSNKTAITLHWGWDAIIAGCYYYFRLLGDGNTFDVDHKRTIREFKERYPEDSKFTGKILSEGYRSFFVNVGGYGCIVQKGVPGSHGIKVGEEHSFSLFSIDDKRHEIHLRVER